MQTDELGRLLVDRTMRSVSHPQVVGVGDAAATPPFVAGQPLRMCCQVASTTYVRAADNVLAELKGKAPKQLHFGYVHQPISIGRKDGLIQFVDRGDRPTRMIKGRKASIYKDFVSASPFMEMRLERVLPGANAWPIREPKRKGLPAGDSQHTLPPPSDQ
jgi:NADH dehydrogenase FAD-containing subunit